MGTYYVTPAPDSSQYNWFVKKGNRKVSQHYKKSAAKREARKRADNDSTVRLQRTDGTFI